MQEIDVFRYTTFHYPYYMLFTIPKFDLLYLLFMANLNIQLRKLQDQHCHLREGVATQNLIY